MSHKSATHAATTVEQATSCRTSAIVKSERRRDNSIDNTNNRARSPSRDLDVNRKDYGHFMYHKIHIENTMAVPVTLCTFRARASSSLLCCAAL